MIIPFRNALAVAESVTAQVMDAYTFNGLIEWDTCRECGGMFLHSDMEVCWQCYDGMNRGAQ